MKLFATLALLLAASTSFAVTEPVSCPDGTETVQSCKLDRSAKGNDFLAAGMFDSFVICKTADETKAVIGTWGDKPLETKVAVEQNTDDSRYVTTIEIAKLELVFPNAVAGQPKKATLKLTAADGVTTMQATHTCN